MTIHQTKIEYTYNLRANLRITNRELAIILGVSERTVCRYIKEYLTKKWK